MNTTENLIQSTASAPRPPINIIKPIKLPTQPHEWKIVSLRECPTPDRMQICDTPDLAVAYWRNHIMENPYYDPERECFAVIILNTRRRIRGHQLVSIGTMDTILVHPREVFRLAIAASASALVLAHNHPSGELRATSAYPSSPTAPRPRFLLRLRRRGTRRR